MKRKRTTILELTEPETFSRTRFFVQKQLRKTASGDVSGVIYIKSKKTGKPIFRMHAKANVVYTQNSIKVDPTISMHNIEIKSRNMHKKQIPAWKYMSSLEKARYISFKEILLKHVKSDTILTSPRIYFMYLSLITEYDIPFLGFNIKVRAPGDRTWWSVRRI